MIGIQISTEPFEYKGRNWFTLFRWGLIGFVAIVFISMGVLMLLSGWLGIFIIAIGLAFLLASLYFGRRVFAIKHLIVYQDGISYFSGEAKVFEARWDEVDALKFSPKMYAKGTSVIRITIEGHEFKLTGEEDLPPLQIEGIFMRMENAWQVAKGIAVESE